MQGDGGTNGCFVHLFDGITIGTFTFPLIGITAFFMTEYGNGIRHDKGRVEPNTELTDDIDVMLPYSVGNEEFLNTFVSAYAPSDKRADIIAFLDDNPLFRVAMEQTEASNPKVTGVWLPSAYQIYYSFQSEIRNVTENGKDIDKAVEDMEAAVQKALDDYAEQNIL